MYQPGRSLVWRGVGRKHQKIWVKNEIVKKNCYWISKWPKSVEKREGWGGFSPTLANSWLRPMFNHYIQLDWKYFPSTIGK